jgi:hypothetical protein
MFVKTKQKRAAKMAEKILCKYDKVKIHKRITIAKNDVGAIMENGN